MSETGNNTTATTNTANDTSTLLGALKNDTNFKETENGATALSSTLSPLVDLFAEIGALRYRSTDDLIALFAPAFAADKLLALKMLFYARDIRGGLGERDTFRRLVNYVATNYPDAFAPNVALIPEFGRWDDLFALFGTPLEGDAIRVIKNQLSADLASDGHPSLLAKWLPSENASSSATRALALHVASALGYSPRAYRRTLSRLRREIRIVERMMSQQNWDEIDYSAVPSAAALRYRNAFATHSPDRYSAYLEALKSGSDPAVKINAGTLFPYDLVGKYYTPHTWDSCFVDTPDPTVEEQWKALPNYLADADTENAQFLVMADTSGSMTSNGALPLKTSVGLAVYFAERAPRDSFFADHFITFTSEPHLVHIPPELNLLDRLRLVDRPGYVGYSTNLEAAFQLVLDSAVRHKLPQSQLPSAILVISDMEIDDAVNRAYNDDDNPVSFTEDMRRRFAAHGYKMPTLVYWNVNARNNTFHAEATDDVRFVSGHSPAVFEGLCKHMGATAFQMMAEILGTARYNVITVGGTATVNPKDKEEVLPA